MDVLLLWTSWGKLGSLCLLSALLLTAFQYLYRVLFLNPQRIREILRQQGIAGPPPSILVGNMKEMKKIQKEEKASRRGSAVIGADYCATLFPYFDKWRKDYGPTFLYSTGNLHQLYVSDPCLVREVALSNSMDLGKPLYMKKHLGALFGQGIMSSNGDSWNYQRKAIAPEFFMDKVKGMVNQIVDAALPLLKKWDIAVGKEGGNALIFVEEDLRTFSADAISRACFGTKYLDGEEIFSRLRLLQKTISKPSLIFGILGLRFLPTKDDREIWSLDREIRSLILNIAKENNKIPTSPGTNLLRTILRSAESIRSNLLTTNDFIVDNCKNLYFAGHDTTAISASWCLMLLASHPKWQDRIRAEVMEVCQGKLLPDAEMLKRMKTVTMVIQETLRLFSPTVFIRRELLSDLKLGDLHVPKGVILTVPISTLHHNPEMWGPDCLVFNPDRFAGGIAAACKLPHVYVPFGFGPRTCLGQNFAMVELKIIISLLVSRYYFSLSPEYAHSPAFRLTVEPEFGVPVFVRRVTNQP